MGIYVCPTAHTHRLIYIGPCIHTQVYTHRYINKQTNKTIISTAQLEGLPNEAAQDRAERERCATHHIRDQGDQKRVGLPRELSRKDLQLPLQPFVPEPQEL